LDHVSLLLVYFMSGASRQGCGPAQDKPLYHFGWMAAARRAAIIFL
jgi:hypothetical protein